MRRALRIALASLAMLATPALAPRPAFAQDRRFESSAREAMKRAAADYASEDFDTAFIRLRKATKACGTIHCSALVRARLHRDLGVMQVKRADRAGAAASFAEALRLDPKITLAAPYSKSSDVQRAWTNAQDEANGVHHEAPPPPPTPAQVAPPPATEPTETSEAVPETPTTDPSRDYARWWVGVAGSFDVLSMPAATNVCKLTSAGLPANAPGYYCTLPSGADYPTRASTSENDSLTQGGDAAGGPSIGAVRAMLSVDYALSASALVGVRLGYLVNGYPGLAAANDGHGFSSKFYGELRGTYLFGDAPLGRTGFAPLVFGGGGLGERVAKTTVHVHQGNAPTVVAGELARVAWLVGGPAFIDVGGGMRYAFSQRIAFQAVLKVSETFGGSGGLAASPEIAVQYGF